MESVAFNGVELTGKYKVLVIRGLPPMQVEAEEVPGFDGYVVKGAKRMPPEITLRFVMGPTPNYRMMERIRELSALLDVREPKRLEFGEDGGLWCMAMPNGSIEWARHVSSGSVDVPFLVTETAMYGKTRTVTVPSGSSVEFMVGGTYPTKPEIAANAVRDASSTVWGVRLDEGDFIHVATGTGSAAQVSVDCGKRTCKVAGATNLPTLDSDWLEFSPGKHTLRMDNGTGAATVTWIERWL